MKVVEDTTNTVEPNESVTQNVPKKTNFLLIAGALALLAVAAVLTIQAGTVYTKGLATLNYTGATGRITTVSYHYNPFGISKTAEVEFTVDNSKKLAEVDLPSDRVFKDGETLQMYYDKNQPANACINQEVDYDTTIVKGAFGLFALCFGTFMLRRSLNR